MNTPSAFTGTIVEKDVVGPVVKEKIQEKIPEPTMEPSQDPPKRVSLFKAARGGKR